MFLYHFCLFNSPWEAVKEETILAFGLLQFLINHFTYEGIIHQLYMVVISNYYDLHSLAPHLPCIHDCLDFLTQFRPGRNSSSQHVAYCREREGELGAVHYKRLSYPSRDDICQTFQPVSEPAQIIKNISEPLELT